MYTYTYVQAYCMYAHRNQTRISSRQTEGQVEREIQVYRYVLVPCVQKYRYNTGIRICRYVGAQWGDSTYIPKGRVESMYVYKVQQRHGCLRYTDMQVNRCTVCSYIQLISHLCIIQRNTH